MDIYFKIDGIFHYNFLEVDGRQNGIFDGYNGTPASHITSWKSQKLISQHEKFLNLQDEWFVGCVLVESIEKKSW